MTIVPCPLCGTWIKAGDQRPGAGVRCPHCDAAFALAEAAPTALGSSPGAATPVDLPGLGPREYEHPLDRQTMDALQRVTGLDFLVRTYYRMMEERSARIRYTGSYLHVSDRAFPDLAATLETACRVLDLSYTPPLYVRWEPAVDVAAFGVDQPMLVITSGAADRLTEAERIWLLGHELAHIKSNHMLYLELANLLPMLGEAIGDATMGIGKLVTKGIDKALMLWLRMADLTADRAGLLACQDRDAALGTLMKMAGLPLRNYVTAGLDTFVDQAREFRDLDSNMLDWCQERDFPWTVLRASELLKWIDEGDYANVLAGTTRAADGRTAGRTRHLGGSRAAKLARSEVLQANAALLAEARTLVEEAGTNDILVAPDILRNKLRSAREAYAKDCPSERVLVLYDATFYWGAAKGCCLTPAELVWTDESGATKRAKLATIRTVELRESEGLFGLGGAGGVVIDGELLPAGRDDAVVLADVIRLAAQNAAGVAAADARGQCK
jgi:Zn-dependent protease with chaperone function